MVNAVSAIAMFRTASSRLLSDMRQVVGARDLVRRLIPVDAGVALPERRERRLVVRARRSGPATERLDGVEIVRVSGARQTSRRSWLELRVVDQDEHGGECQPLRAHGCAIGGDAGGVGRHWPTAVPPVNAG